MGKIEKYRAVIKKVLNRHIGGHTAPMDEYETQIVTDDANGHYFLYGVGWEGLRRVHGCTLHLDLKGDKIWIQQDWTEDGVANDLEKEGVPKSDIVLAFQAPYRRVYMKEYAAG